MKTISLFSGIGAFEKAIERLGVPLELVGFSEIDKAATKSYCSIHGVDEEKNLGDITKIDETKLPKKIDLITYGFPCQDISNAGKQKGMFECEHCHSKYELEEGDAEKIRNGEKFFCEKCGHEIKLTRSGLFFEALRIIEATQPRIAIAENVKNLTSKKFSEQFKIVLDSLEQAGYNNYWQVLNAKDYGIPQNRERVFIISIRKDIDTGKFDFPEGFPLELKLKDMLEEEVEEKYFLNKDFQLLKTTGNVCGMVDMKADECIRRIYDTEKEAPTLTTMCGGHRQPKIFVREATKTGYAEAVAGDSINFEHPNSKTRRGRVGRGVAQTLTTSPQQGAVIQNRDDLKIRKLTPKECFRLMGFDDSDFINAEKVNSNSQLYKQAGNSIVVDVLEHIFKSLIEANVFESIEYREKQREIAR